MVLGGLWGPRVQWRQAVGGAGGQRVGAEMDFMSRPTSAPHSLHRLRFWTSTNPFSFFIYTPTHRDTHTQTLMPSTHVRGLGLD